MAPGKEYLLFLTESYTDDDGQVLVSLAVNEGTISLEDDGRKPTEYDQYYAEVWQNAKDKYLVGNS